MRRTRNYDVLIHTDTLKAELFDELYNKYLNGEIEAQEVAIAIIYYGHVLDLIDEPEI